MRVDDLVVVELVIMDELEEERLDDHSLALLPDEEGVEVSEERVPEEQGPSASFHDHRSQGVEFLGSLIQVVVVPRERVPTPQLDPPGTQIGSRVPVEPANVRT